MNKLVWAKNHIVRILHLFIRAWIPFYFRKTFGLKPKIQTEFKMKLGVAYNLFDGEELLEYSIKSIRKNVDFICVVWQKISNHGEACNPEVPALLDRLVAEGLVDKLYLYEPNIKNTGGQNASMNETEKRNIGLELCREALCSHHLTIDTDEFYSDEEMRFMKTVMEIGDYGTGYCQHRQYYKDSIYQVKYPERQYVATIEKISPETKYVYAIPCVVGIDPTRKTNNVKELGMSYRIFARQECQMHHLSFVRRDIKKKLWNHSSKRFFTEESVDRIVDYYKNWKYPAKAMWAGEALREIIEVPRQFEIYKVD
jgi:hypothetical protein